MMFSREDFRLPPLVELIEFLPILVFLGLVAPFLIAAYSLGFVMDKVGWLNTDS